MPAGINIRTPDGFIQVDDANLNLQFFSKVSVTTTTTVGNASYGSYTVTGLTGMPLVACLSSAGATARVASYNATAGSAVITFSSKGASGQGVVLYIFAPPKESTDNGGFEVRSAAGKLAFNGGPSYMKVVYGPYSVTPSTSEADIAVATLASGRTYAAMCFVEGFAQRDINEGSGGITAWKRYSHRAFVKISGTSLIVAGANFQITSYGSSLPGPGPYSASIVFFIVDVTGM